MQIYSLRQKLLVYNCNIFFAKELCKLKSLKPVTLKEKSVLFMIEINKYKAEITTKRLVSYLAITKVMRKTLFDIFLVGYIK